MIDYLKIHHMPVEAKKVLNNDLLTFPLSNIATTGEVLNRSQIANFRGMQVIVRGSNVGLKGSLHKYFEGGTNYKDFSLQDIQATITELSNNLEFDPAESFVNFIEVGVNIPLTYSPTELIKSAVIYRNNPFTELPVKGKGYGRICNTQRFTIKIYDKSLQYGLLSHLLRVEVKVKKTEFLKQYGISSLSLADLLRKEAYPPFLQMLADTIEGILFFDPRTTPDEINDQKDRDLFIEGRYPEYWQNLSRTTKNRKIQRFTELAGSEKIKSDLIRDVKEKWNKLTTLQTGKEKQKTEQINRFQDEKEESQTEQINHHREPEQKRKTEQINPTINSYFVPLCPVTNLRMENQKPGCKYLSEVGIKFYFENDLEIYNSKLRSLLTKKWILKHKNDPEKIFIKEIYHQIRNRANNPKNNPRNNTKNSYRHIIGRGPVMFPVEETLSKEKRNLIFT